MKKMKNLLMLLLGIALIFSFAGAGAAGTVSGTNGDLATSKTSDVSVTYTQTGSYEVTLPENIVLSSTEGVHAQVGVNSATVGDDRYLLVSVASKNSWKVKDEDNNELQYKMSYYSGDNKGDEYYTGDSLSSNGEAINLLCIGDVSGGLVAASDFETEKYSKLYFELVGTPNFGTYEDTLTFTISVTDQNASRCIEKSETKPDWVS